MGPGPAAGSTPTVAGPCMTHGSVAAEADATALAMDAAKNSGSITAMHRSPANWQSGAVQAWAYVRGECSIGWHSSCAWRKRKGRSRAAITGAPPMPVL